MSKSEQQKILLVVDQLFYPATNGVTLPVLNYYEGLAEVYDVTVVLILDVSEQIDSEKFEDNCRRFGAIQVVRMHRASKLRRILDEIFCVEMFQHGWKEAISSDVSIPCKPLAAIVSPISAVAKWRSSGLQAAVCPTVSIAAVSDCTTAEYYNRGKMALGKRQFMDVLISFTHKLRSRFIATIEQKLLLKYDKVLLQTSADLNLMRSLVSKTCADKVLLAPNGVNPELFNLPRKGDGATVVFVAALDGEYSRIAMWIVKELWPQVLQAYPKAHLEIVGKNPPLALVDAINSMPTISHHPFVRDLGDIYERADVALSPILKGFGLINKTLEAMAAEVPVVGGRAAFNGIDGFNTGEHGIACHSASTSEFADAIVYLLKNPDRNRQIGAAGRDLIRKQFEWTVTVDSIKSFIEEKRNSNTRKCY